MPSHTWSMHARLNAILWAYQHHFLHAASSAQHCQQAEQNNSIECGSETFHLCPRYISPCYSRPDRRYGAWGARTISDGGPRGSPGGGTGLGESGSDWNQQEKGPCPAALLHCLRASARSLFAALRQAWDLLMALDGICWPQDARCRSIEALRQHGRRLPPTRPRSRPLPDVAAPPQRPLPAPASSISMATAGASSFLTGQRRCPRALRPLITTPATGRRQAGDAEWQLLGRAATAASQPAAFLLAAVCTALQYRFLAWRCNLQAPRQPCQQANMCRRAAGSQPAPPIDRHLPAAASPATHTCLPACPLVCR
jgi:hypothetical protein